MFQSNSKHGTIPDNLQGAIDVDDIKKSAANILEGGKEAFERRKTKYGF